MYVLGEGASLGGMRRGYAAGAADQREPKRPPGAKRGMRRVCAGGMRRPRASLTCDSPQGAPGPPQGAPRPYPQKPTGYAPRVCGAYIYIYIRKSIMFSLISDGVSAIMRLTPTSVQHAFTERAQRQS